MEFYSFCRISVPVAAGERLQLQLDRPMNRLQESEQ